MIVYYDSIIYSDIVGREKRDKKNKNSGYYTLYVSGLLASLFDVNNSETLTNSTRPN